MILNMISRSILFVFICLLAISGGCRDLKEDVTEKEYAIELLNKRQYEEAITLLIKLNKKDPDDDELKLLLASAYSGSVGINVVDAFDVFKPLIFSKDLPSHFSDKSKKPDDGTQTNYERSNFSRDLEKQIILFLDKIADGFGIFFSMPYTRQEHRGRMVEALLTIKDIQPESKFYRRTKNYLVLLNIAQFLNYTKDALPNLDSSKKVTTLSLICAFEVEHFVSNMIYSIPYLSDAVQEFKIAMELSKKTASSKLQSLQKTVKELEIAYNINKGAFVAADLGFNASKKHYCD